VLSYVETGNVDAGIVYTTDAKESKQVRQAVTAPANLHSPIVYPVAVLKRTRRADAAKAFVQFLSSNEAKAVFEKYGFGIAD
jgi:molybdate transport system substrate-binding protein